MHATGIDSPLLKQALLGNAELAGIPDRTFTRGQGCWSCIHAQTPIDRWFGKENHGKGGIRGQMLERATKLSLNSPRGEKAEAVVRIRLSIERIDSAIAHQAAFVCDHGVTEDGNPVGDFVASAFLCKNWSGRDGASLARAADGKLDDLPGELRDKVDGSSPLDIKDFEDEYENVIEKTPGALP